MAVALRVMSSIWVISAEKVLTVVSVRLFTVCMVAIIGDSRASSLGWSSSMRSRSSVSVPTSSLSLSTPSIASNRDRSDQQIGMSEPWRSQ